MQFGVLGALEVHDADGTPIRLSGPVRRRLLAALICRAGRAVPPSVLIENLWGSVPPRSAAKTLQSHVVRLRTDLGRGGGVVRTDAAGYRIDTTVAGIDALRFEQLVHDAGTGRPEDVLRHLDEARALWRDDAYLEFGDAPFAVGERLRLAEIRTVANERRADLLLEFGRTEDVIAETELRLAAEPYRERGWEQLVLALYRSGRQADALGAYRRARDLLAAELGVDPGPDLRDLELRILRQDPSLLGPSGHTRSISPSRPRNEECPYRGLAGYSDRDAELFSGRERLTAELAGLLVDHAGIVVTGPSGCGKSSVLRAGLVASLRVGALPGSATWRSAVTTPSTFTNLPADLDLVVLDQAEELFTVLDQQRATSVVDDLALRRAAGARVVVAVRGDHFERLAGFPFLAALTSTTVLVRALRDDELRRVVVEPSERHGYVVEPALVEVVLDEVSGQPGALPLLSAALVRTWQNREGSRLTLSGYHRGGGIGAALEAMAEEAYAALAPAAQIAARRLLLRMVGLQGQTWTRRPIPLDELRDSADEPAAAALAALTADRLVTIGAGQVEIVHDALLTGWPRLRDWLDERARGADLLDHLNAAARSWEQQGRPDSELYRGARLQAAQDWVEDHPQDVTDREVAFVAASQSAAQDDLSRARARADREAAGRRRLRYAVIGLVAALVLAVVGGGFALQSRDAARRQTLDANARRLAAEALNATDLRTELLLAVAAYRLQDSPDTRSALLSALERNGAAKYRISTPNRLLWVTTDAAADTVWAADNNGNVLRYSAADRRLEGTFPLQKSQNLAVTPDGRLMAGMSDDSNDVVVVNARTGAVVFEFTGAAESDDSNHQTFFTPDGRRLVVTNWNADGAKTTFSRAIHVFATNDLSAAPRVLTADAPVIAAAVGSRVVAALTDRGELEEIDLASGRVLTRRHVAAARTPIVDNAGPPFAVTPDGRYIAVAIATAPWVELIDMRTPHAPVRSAQVPQDSYEQIGFSLDGRLLAAGGSNGTVAVVRARDGQRAADLPGENGPVMSVAWGRPPPGAQVPQLFSGGLDSQIVSWDLSGGPRMLAMHGTSFPQVVTQVYHATGFGFGPRPPNFGGTATPAQEKFSVWNFATARHRSWSMGWAPGDTVNSLSNNPAQTRALVCVIELGGKRCDLWDLTTQRRLAHLELPTGSEDSGMGAIDATGTTAAIGTGLDTVGVYRLPSFRLLRTITVHFRGPTAWRVEVEPELFAPDGRLIVEGADDGPEFPSPGSSELPADPLVDAVDLATGAVSGQVGLGVTGDLDTVNWSRDGRRAVVGTSGGQLWLLDSHSLRPIVSAVDAVSGFVLSAEWSPDDSTIVVGGTDSTMALFDARTLERIGPPIVLPGADWVEATYDGHGQQIAGLAPIGNDQQRLFTFPGDATDWAALACSIAGSELTRTEWRNDVGSIPYRPVCPS